MGTGTYNIPTRIPVSHIDPPAFLYDLFDLSATFFGSTLVACTEQLIGSLGNGRWEDGVKRKDGEGLVKPLIAEPLPDTIYALLRRELALFLLFVCIVRAARRGNDTLVLAITVFIVRLGRGRVAVHGGELSTVRVIWRGRAALGGYGGAVRNPCEDGNLENSSVVSGGSR